MNKNKETPFKIRLNKLKLVNFKRFDEIELEFPKPFHKEDLDIFVMGSQNGLGKTSILEAISLLFLYLSEKESHVNRIFREYEHYFPFNLSDYFIKAGNEKAIIQGYFEIPTDQYSLLNEYEHYLEIHISKQSGITLKGESPAFKE